MNILERLKAIESGGELPIKEDIDNSKNFKYKNLIEYAVFELSKRSQGEIAVAIQKVLDDL